MKVMSISRKRLELAQRFTIIPFIDVNESHGMEGTIADVVLRDLDIHFHDQTIC